MLVIYKNDFYTLDMQYCIFIGLQESCPECDVEIIHLDSSTYKKPLRVPIGELNDYSVERNLNALNN